MRILIIASYAPSLINFRGALLLEMVNRGHEVIAAAPVTSDQSYLRQQLSGLGVFLSPLPITRGGINPFKDIHTLLCIYRLIAKHKPSAVLSYTVKPVVYSGLAVWLYRLLFPSGLPRFFALITGLGYAFADVAPLLSVRAIIRGLVIALYRFGLHSSNAIIFQNPDDYQVFSSLRLLPNTAKVHRVWGSGVDLDLFPATPLPSRHVFLMLSRIIREKGVHDYVAASRIVRRQFPEAIFLLAGMLESSPAAIPSSELESWVREGVIQYLGELRSVQTALADCRYYVLPSFREGTPRSVLEALATARPVITTDVPGCRETVVQGLNGLLIPPRNPEALAAAMLKLIEQPQAETERMAQASLDLARERFDVHKVNAQLLAVMGA